MPVAKRAFIVLSACAAFIVLFLLFRLFLYDDAELAWVEQCRQRKEACAALEGGPKLLVVGGSATLFGVSAELLRERLGIPACNLAIHAGLGTRYSLGEARRFARAGDYVLLPLEWSHLADRQRYSPFYTSYMLRHAREGDELPPPLTVAASSLRSGLVHSLTRHAASLAGAEAKSAAYSAQSLSSVGDLTAPRGPVWDKLGKLAPKSSPRLLPDAAAVEDILEFNAWCGQNGVTLLLSFASTVDFAAYAEAEYRARFQAIVQYFEENGVAVVGSCDTFLYPVSLFHDTEYHLTDAGARTHTERLASLLRQRISPRLAD